jgi:hypothetical protein
MVSNAAFQGQDHPLMWIPITNFTASNMHSVREWRCKIILHKEEAIRSTYFLPRDISPYITPVAKIKPLPNMICSS